MLKTTLNEQNMPATASSKLPASTRWALAGLSLSVLLPSLATSVSSVALPTFARVYQAPVQDVQWIVLAYLLVTTSLIVGVGRLGDIVGRKRMLLAGILLFSSASVAGAVAPTLWMLIAARALQGLGAAAMMALTLAFIGEIVPKERTGAAMGLLGTMSAVGTALGPTLGGVLLAGPGWPAIFLINVPVGIVAAVLTYRFLPGDRSSSMGTARSRFDHPGTLTLALTLTAYSLAATSGQGHIGIVNVIMLSAASVGAVLFVVAELRSPSPMIPLAALRDGLLGSALAMSALVTTVVMATLVVGPFYLSEAFDLDAVGVGLVMSVGPVVAALTGLPAGRLVDKFGSHRMTIAGITAMAVGTSLLPVVPVHFGVTGYIAPLALLTAGYGLFQAANNTGVMAGISSENRGVVSGMMTMSRNLGLITGASVMGAVFAAASGMTDVIGATAEPVTAGMRVTFTLAAVLIAVALAIAVGSRLLAGRQPKIARSWTRYGVQSS